MAVKPGNGGGERDARLDRLYRDAGHETPPAHLDAAILAAARREVGARPRPLSALRRWRVPVSIAAVVVLSVSLVTLVREEGGDIPLRDERLPAAPPTAGVLQSPQQPAEPAKAPATGRLAARAEPDRLSLRLDEAPKAAAQAEGTVARDAASSGAASGPESASGPPAANVGGRASSQAVESSPRPAAEAARRQASPGESRDIAAAPAAPQAKPMERRMRAEPALALTRPPAWQGLEQEPPQKWVERLTDLRKAARTVEADELLAEFKRRFPDYPLPSD